MAVTKVNQDQSITVAAGKSITLSGGGAIVGADIQAAAGSIGTTELADKAVTLGKLADAVVSTLATDFGNVNTALAAADAAVDLNGQAFAAGILSGEKHFVSEALTIASGVITPDGSGLVLLVSTEAAEDDNLDTIDMTSLPSTVGTRVVVSNVSQYTITLTTTGNIAVAVGGSPGDYELDAARWVVLYWNGTKWDIDSFAYSPGLSLTYLGDQISAYEAAPESSNTAVPVMLRFEVATGATSHTLYDANLPFALRIVDVVVKSLGTPGGAETIKLTNGSNDITDAIAAATANTIARAATIDEAYCELAANASLVAVSSATGVTAEIVVWAVRQ